MTLTMKTETVEKQPSVCCGIDIEHVHFEEGDSSELAAGRFKALADPTRLRILKAIAATGELCECNIVPSFGLSQPTISYHLKVLRDADLVQSERRGQWVYHQVNGKAVLNMVRSLTELA